MIIKLGSELLEGDIILYENNWYKIIRQPFLPFCNGAGHMEFGSYSTIDIEVVDSNKWKFYSKPSKKENVWIFERQPFIVKNENDKNKS